MVRLLNTSSGSGNWKSREWEMGREQEWEPERKRETISLAWAVDSDSSSMDELFTTKQPRLAQ